MVDKDKRLSRSRTEPQEEALLFSQWPLFVLRWEIS